MSKDDRDHCYECGMPFVDGRHSFNLTWVGGPPQRTWCDRVWCRDRREEKRAARVRAAKEKR